MSDYSYTQFVGPPIGQYLSPLAEVSGGIFQTVDVVDMGRGVTSEQKGLGRTGSLVPPFFDPALIHTFLLFDYVLWYTDVVPSLGVAQQTIFTYLQNGGKVLFATSFRESYDSRGALKDFAPVDSICTEDLVRNRPLPSRGSPSVNGNYKVYPDSTDPNNIYPLLATNFPPFQHTVFMRPVYKRSDARYLYHLQPDTANAFPIQYIGMPNIAVVDGQRTIVFFGLPLHILDNRAVGNPRGIVALYERVFTSEFDENHRIDRRRF
jgi:hypothetical protein